MYALELAFSDDPGRLVGRPARRECLAGLRDEGGAVLLFRVDTRDAADRIVAADPCYSGPGVTVTSLKEWTPVTLAPELG